MSDSVRSHRQQPTRLLCPWDSPGKNTGVGFHFLLQCMKVKPMNMRKLHLLPNLGNKASHPVNSATDRIWHVTFSVNWVKLLEKVEFFPHKYSEYHWPKLATFYPLKSYFIHCLQQKFNWKEYSKCLSLFFLPF